MATLPDGRRSRSGAAAEQRPPGAGNRGAVASLEPRIILFGDMIKAHVDVLLDRRKVDPRSVRVSTEFLPWEIVGPQIRTRRDSGASTYLRSTFTLRCTSSPCLPNNTASALEFTRARSSRTRPRARLPSVRRSIAVDWPILLVYSRFAVANAEGSTSSSAALWRADLESFPSATYGIPPRVLLPVLLALDRASHRRRRRRSRTSRSLADRMRRSRSPSRSRSRSRRSRRSSKRSSCSRMRVAPTAPKTVAARSSSSQRCSISAHPELARAARTLAWSEHDPLVEQTSGLGDEGPDDVST